MIILRLSFMKRKGIALFPFIFLKHKSDFKDVILINHEKIHIRQQLELFVIPFYLIYGIHYLYNLIQQFSHESAYRNILFEKEAYDHENDLSYLNKRKLFSFLNYL
ncbi:MAG: hypothetical protein IPP71_17925 [Bacteroidetes bacterium]|nr:hypothetical protein [Bacteroidota bacterium]